VLTPIDIGDSLPSYILKNEQGEDIDVAKLTEEKGVILFSIPKADTRKCDVIGVERQSINRWHSGLHDAGVRVPRYLSQFHGTRFQRILSQPRQTRGSEEVAAQGTVTVTMQTV
jgi:hypothetical protein